MSESDEYRCFVGGLSWSTSDRGLRDAFENFGRLTEAKVVVDKFSGRSRGFGFVTFDEKQAMDEAIDKMNGMDIDGRQITVDKAQPQGGGGGGRGGRDRDGGRDYDRGRDRDRGRDYGGGRGSGGDECFKCGKPGHFARECPNAGGDRYSGKDDRYGGGGGRYGPDRNGDRHGDRYSGGRSRDGGSRGGSGSDRDGGSRGGSGSDRYNRDRSGPYERPSGGEYRS